MCVGHLKCVLQFQIFIAKTRVLHKLIYDYEADSKAKPMTQCDGLHFALHFDVWKKYFGCFQAGVNANRRFQSAVMAS